MPISFTTSRSTSDRKKTYVPKGAQSVSELSDYNDIKKKDLEVGASVGAGSSVERTWVDPSTWTFLHGEVGIIARLKFNRSKEG
ncbi:MAG: hypothetical protein QY322_02640 [bacterium]|nr:MAG: hypothetical protein QY322_02640 [bacterium]